MILEYLTQSGVEEMAISPTEAKLIISEARIGQFCYLDQITGQESYPISIKFDLGD